MDDGQVDSMERITLKSIPYDLARESGFDSVKDLLETAKHGAGTQGYLIRFHHMMPGVWQ